MWYNNLPIMKFAVLEFNPKQRVEVSDTLYCIVLLSLRMTEESLVMMVVIPWRDGGLMTIV